jgi:hypothetical protein
MLTLPEMRQKSAFFGGCAVKVRANSQKAEI